MELTTASPAVRAALEFAARYGWKVFPVTAGDKRPALKGWQALATDDPLTWAGWWSADGTHPDTIVGAATGPGSGIWAVDFDPGSGGADSLAALTAEHDGDWGIPLAVSTPSGGRHHIYAYPSAEELAELGVTRIKNRTGVLAGIDIRAGGGLIVCPGPEGRTPLGAPPAEISRAPGWLLELAVKQDGDTETGGSSAGTSKLADLLKYPPAGIGGRNDWLTRVAGHLAARENHEDAYAAQVWNANQSLNPPLPEDEVEKITRSIWQTELKKAKSGGSGGARLPESVIRAAERVTKPTEGSGRADGPVGLDEVDEAATALTLLAGGLRPHRRGGARTGHLLVDVLEKVGDKQVRKPAEWADFDIVATGVTDDADDERLYQVTVIRGRDGKRLEAILPAAVLIDRRKLNAWLARFGVTIGKTPNPVLQLDGAERLLRYIEAQQPPVFEPVHHLGYSDEAKVFITPEGVVTAGGLESFGRYRLHPAVAKAARRRFRYGHDRTEGEVRVVLNEVLTFHHDAEAAVFGAWWAASLLKHVAMRHTSLFPFMAVEAPSESGKTTGMFGMLIELTGAVGGQQTYTKASFRDDLALNRNAIVWLDDADSVEHLEEVLRAATAEGTMTKKAEDLTYNQGAHLVAPVVVSGEHLGFREEKALRDRAIHLEVRSPTDRMSLRDPAVEQYVDLKRLRSQESDLSVFAGTLIRMALAYADEFADDIGRLRKKNGRRVGDAAAILQAGALLLERLTGDEGWYDAVAHWLDENGLEDTGQENALTLVVLPELLEIVGRRAEPTKFASNHRFDLATPVLVRGDEVWVSAKLCAMWWERIKHGRIELRTQTAPAFAQQLRALGAIRSTRVRVDGADAAKVTYYRLPDDVAARVLAR